MSQSTLAFNEAAPHSTFNFGAHTVRVIVRDGQPWFVATDVAMALGYSSPKDAAEHLDADEKGSAITRTPGGDQRVTVINESGLYALVLRSRKPEARKFAKWVTGEVLPSIRKTGSYAKPAADAERITLANRLASHAASAVHQTVFEAILAADDKWWKHDRYMLSFNYGADSSMSVPHAKAIQQDQVVVSLNELAKRISDPDSLGSIATDQQLASIIEACAARLSLRAQMRSDIQIVKSITA
ncbi:Bro-N domain-containing protein [Comamonas aquatica]|uniref:BRO-N domain-containing protein n=1 Tax=Comamonas aquatica TaxID=225991 RepID=UPI002446E1E0|nr:Bro-N domain-containing protein [Comamonas aquatica]MDH1766522.1 Bro-N domain-containing protein [Comamonas aquatica]